MEINWIIPCHELRFYPIELFEISMISIIMYAISFGKEQTTSKKVDICNLKINPNLHYVRSKLIIQQQSYCFRYSWCYRYQSRLKRLYLNCNMYDLFNQYHTRWQRIFQNPNLCDVIQSISVKVKKALFIL